MVRVANMGSLNPANTEKLSPENLFGKTSQHEKRLQWNRITPRKLGNVEFGGSQVLKA